MRVVVTKTIFRLERKRHTSRSFWGISSKHLGLGILASQSIQGEPIEKGWVPLITADFKEFTFDVLVGLLEE